MTIERQESLREILKVLRHPAVAPWFPHAGADGFIPPVGGDVLFLKLGSGFLAYFLAGNTAEVHACLLPGEPHPDAKILEQFEHLFAHGVRRIWAAPANARAERKAKKVGMQDTGKRTKRGFPIYEVTHG